MIYVILSRILSIFVGGNARKFGPGQALARAPTAARPPVLRSRSGRAADGPVWVPGRGCWRGRVPGEGGVEIRGRGGTTYWFLPQKIFCKRGHFNGRTPKTMRYAWRVSELIAELRASRVLLCMIHSKLPTCVDQECRQEELCYPGEWVLTVMGASVSTIDVKYIPPAHIAAFHRWSIQGLSCYRKQILDEIRK